MINRTSAVTKQCHQCHQQLRVVLAKMKNERPLAYYCSRQRPTSKDTTKTRVVSSRSPSYAENLCVYNTSHVQHVARNHAMLGAYHTDKDVIHIPSKPSNTEEDNHIIHSNSYCSYSTLRC